MINESKPTTSISNPTQPNKGETWASITTTWATEIRTWIACSKLINNITGIVNLDFLMTEDDNYLVQETEDYIITEQCTPIINVTRPI